MKSKLNPEAFKEDDVIRYVAGELNEEKKELIEDWIQANEKNRRIYRELKLAWEVGSSIKQSESIDVESARKNVFRNLHFFRIRQVLNTYRKIAAFMLLPILGTFIIYIISVRSISFDKLKNSNGKTFNEINVAYGMRLNVILPDGTKVWLNSGSYFKYPNQFMGNKREVYLEGEGYFEIVENKKVPFVIGTRGPDIVATGTIVDVLAYPADDLVETSLIRGKVHLALRTDKKCSKSLADLNSGEKVTFRKDNGSISKKKINSDDVTSWIKGYLIFNNDSFDEVARKLSRWYNIDIILTDDSLKTYTYTATFVDETISQVMELLKISAPIDYKISTRTKLTGNTFSKRKVEIWLKK